MRDNGASSPQLTAFTVLQIAYHSLTAGILESQAGAAQVSRVQSVLGCH
jgi:hypothetical protein